MSSILSIESKGIYQLHEKTGVRRRVRDVTLTPTRVYDTIEVIEETLLLKVWPYRTSPGAGLEFWGNR